jgi:hypothetical protein
VVRKILFFLLFLSSAAVFADEYDYARIGQRIAREIYSRTIYDYDYRARNVGNKVGRAPQESPDPYPRKICTGFSLEFFELFNREMKKYNLYPGSVRAIINDIPGHWKNIIIDNIHKKAFTIEPQTGEVEVIDYDRLPTKSGDLYYSGSTGNILVARGIPTPGPQPKPDPPQPAPVVPSYPAYDYETSVFWFANLGAPSAAMDTSNLFSGGLGLSLGIAAKTNIISTLSIFDYARRDDKYELALSGLLGYNFFDRIGFYGGCGFGFNWQEAGSPGFMLKWEAASVLFITDTVFIDCLFSWGGILDTALFVGAGFMMEK